MNLEITKQGAIIHITEQTLRELYDNMIKFKEEKSDYEAVGIIKSEYSPFSFVIHIETQPRTQESLGFRIDKNQIVVNKDEEEEEGPEEEKLKELEEKFNTLKNEVKQLQTNDNLLLEIDRVFKEALYKISAEIKESIKNELQISTNMIEISKILEQILDREKELRQIVDKLSQQSNKAIAQA